MIAQARSELPNECCGVLAAIRGQGSGVGSQGSEVRGQKSEVRGQNSETTSLRSEIPFIRVERRYALVNSAASPTEYLSDARSMFEAVRDMRPLGLEIVAVYHSH